MTHWLKRIVMVAILAALAYGGWVGWQQWRARNAERNTLGEIPTATAEVRDVIVSVSANGLLQPIRVVEVKSKAAGEITQMPAELGDFLERGALVAQVDTETLTQELQQAQADLDSAKTRLDIAQNQYERANELFNRGLISRNDLETNQQSFATARAALLRSEADVKLRQERLDDATVRAPISGTIIAKEVEEGQIIQSSVNTVSGGTTLVQMADLSELEIRTLVDEIDIGPIKPGMRVESTVEAFPDRRFEGTVIKIEPQAVVQNQVTTFPVLSRIENDQGLLLPGMNAAVDIIVHRSEQVLTVPNEAVREPADAAIVAELLGIEIDRAALQRAFVDVARASPSEGNNGRSNGASRQGRAPQAGRGAGGSGGAGRGGQARGGGGRGGEGRGGDDAGDGPAPDRPSSAEAFGLGSEPSRAVVFVVPASPDAAGYEARPVLVGVRDWERAEIVAGLQPGDRVVLLPSTSLLQSQEELRERFSRRSMIPGLRR